MRAPEGGDPGVRPPGSPHPQSHTAQNPAKSNRSAARSIANLSQIDKCYDVGAPQNDILPFAVYTISETAQLLHVSERKVRDLVSRGLLPRLSHTRTLHFWGEDLISFLRSASGSRGEAS